MYQPAEEFDKNDKREILLAILSGYEGHLLHLSNSTKTLSVAACTGLIAFPFLIGTQIKSMSFFEIILVLGVSTVVTALVVWVVIKNARHYRWLCRAVTRVKQALGLFEERLFSDPNNQKGSGYEYWFESNSMLPVESQRWGADFGFFTDFPHVAAVVVSYLASAGVILSMSNVF